MSRTYSYKPTLKKRDYRVRQPKNIELRDYEIEYLETALGSSIKLKV